MLSLRLQSLKTALSFLFFAPGYAKLNNKLAVVLAPGMAIARRLNVVNCRYCAYLSFDD